jgi:hypothetical protein
MTEDQYHFIQLLHLESTGEILPETTLQTSTWSSDNLLAAIRNLNRYLWEYTSGQSFIEWYGPQHMVKELETQLYQQLMLILAGDVLHRVRSLKNRKGI